MIHELLNLLEGKVDIQFSIAILAAALYVFETNKDKTMFSRVVITVSSAGLGYSITPELSAHIGGMKILVGILVTALGFLALEVSGAIVRDREFIKEALLRKLGK